MRNDIAVVFPGQGSQRKGMGRDFHDQIPECHEIYENASKILGWNVAAMCFEEDDRLHLTAYSQPCILTTEIAMLKGLEKRFGFESTWFGGHSLGEYSALVASGAMSFERALKTVHKRGQLMQSAAPAGFGTMAAVIADNVDADKLRHTLTGLFVDIANINSKDQVVVSGMAIDMNHAKNRIEKICGTSENFRWVPLNVSAPFHSRFMHSIRDDFREILTVSADKIQPDKAPCVTSNFTGGYHCGDPHMIIDNLVEQLCHPVQWLENMYQLSKKTTQIYEIGPNKPLRKFFKSIGRDCVSIMNLKDAEHMIHKG
jgi:[acyl-carrier-protein] S-malonyltransferase/trans-AT polyketide synthase/acyltransferase/oxidoreductase domain-containing protein